MVAPAVGGGLKLNVTAVLSSALLCPTPLQMVAPVDGAAKVEPASDNSKKPLKLGVPVSVSVVNAVVDKGPGAVTTYGLPLCALPWPPAGPAQSPGRLL